MKFAEWLSVSFYRPVVTGSVVRLGALTTQACSLSLVSSLLLGCDDRRTPAAAPVTSAEAPSVGKVDGGATTFPAPPDYAHVEFVTERIASDFYTLTGSPGVDPGHPEAAGGRLGALVMPDGIVLVDASYAPLTDKIVTALGEISSAPIRYLIDTHAHPDHTGGNPNIVKRGALLIAREEVRNELIQPLPAAVGDAASNTDPARLPTLTFGLGAPLKIYMDDETVDLIPVPAAHTDGDALVRFERADVIMIGDFYRNYGYPFVDQLHGGTFQGVLGALDLLMTLAGPNTVLVPGHGSTIQRDAIPAYRAMIVDIQAQVSQMIGDGKSLQDVLAAHLTAPYDASVEGGLDELPVGLGVSSADRFVSEVYADSSAGT